MACFVSPPDLPITLFALARTRSWPVLHPKSSSATAAMTSTRRSASRAFCAFCLSGSCRLLPAGLP